MGTGLGMGIWERDWKYRNGNTGIEVRPGIQERDQNREYRTGNMGTATRQRIRDREWDLYWDGSRMGVG